MAQQVKNLPAMQETEKIRWGLDPRVGKMPWRRKWQSTLAFLPGESHEQKSLEGYSPWGNRRLDVTEQLSRCYILFQLYFVPKP